MYWERLLFTVLLKKIYIYSHCMTLLKNCAVFVATFALGLFKKKV